MLIAHIAAKNNDNRNFFMFVCKDSVRCVRAGHNRLLLLRSKSIEYLALELTALLLIFFTVLIGAFEIKTVSIKL
jgi:hypothetical protein